MNRDGKLTAELLSYTSAIAWRSYQLLAGKRPSEWKSGEKTDSRRRNFLQVGDMDSFTAAAELLQAGISVFPIGANKVPSIAWKEYCKRLPTEDEVIDWFSKPAGVGRICGAVSGNLEVIDFDVDDEVDPETFTLNSREVVAEWGRLIEEQCPGLLQRVNTIQTPRPGWHVTYKCEEAVEGNQKLATVKSGDGKWKAIIETRGEGGYALCPGSPAFCHPQGGHLYFHVSGPALEALTPISAEERNILLQAARTFNQKTEEPVEHRETLTPVEHDGNSPGDEFIQRVTWAEILTPHGFTHVQTDSTGVSYWKRAGSSNKWSASTGYGNSGLFYAFSPNCGVDAERGYSKFSMFTHLNHAGNFEASSKALRAQGFGTEEAIESADINAIRESLRKSGAEPQKEPGLPERFLSVPGIVRAMIDYNLATSFIPQPSLALAGSLAFMGTLIGRKVIDDVGTRANAYIIGLADSGRGKEQSRKVNKSLSEAANCDDMIGPEGFASGAGLLKAVTVNPSILFQVDEIGRMLRTVGKPSSSPHLYEIITILMKLFTSSNSRYLGNAYADNEKKNLVIESPNCNLYGTTVPESFFESLSVESLTDGFMSRLMVFEGLADQIPQRPASIPMPQELIDQVQAWREFQEGNVDIWAAPRLVHKTHEASEMMWDFQQAAYQTGRGKVEKALWSRAAEKANKLALIYACSESFNDCEIGTNAADWAIGLSSYLTQRMIDLADEHVCENEHERSYKRIENAIREKGVITLAELGRRSRFLPVYMRDKIIEDMEQKGQVTRYQEASSSRGRPKWFLKWEGA